MTEATMVTIADEPRLDRLVELATTSLRVPLAVIGLFADDVDRLESDIGTELVDISDEVASWARSVVAADSPMPYLIAEADRDRTSDWQFCAGQLLRNTDGRPMGALCVASRSPRDFTDTDRQALMLVATLVEEELGRRIRTPSSDAVTTEQENQVILDHVSEGLLVRDAGGRIIRWNAAAERLLGSSGDEFARRMSLTAPWDVIRTDGSPWEVELAPASIALRTKAPVSAQVMGFPRPDGTRQWSRVSACPLFGADGEISLIITTFADVNLEVAEMFQREELAAALERSEQLATISLDALEEGVLLVDQSAVILRCNPAAERILGYTSEQLVDLWRSETFQVWDASGNPIEREDRPIYRAVAGGVAVIGEIIGWQRSDGERVQIRMSCLPEVNLDEGAVVTVTDVTEELRDRKLLDTILEVAPVGLVVVDAHGAVLRCNQTFAAAAGRTAEELVGIDVLKFVHPDDREQAGALVAEVVAGDVSKGDLDLRIVSVDGEETWVSSRLSAVANDDRAVAVGATFDITERRRMENELARFSRLIFHANDAIFVIDRTGVVQYRSPSAFRLLGYPADADLGDRFGELVHPDDRAFGRDEFMRLLNRAGDGRAHTLRLRTYQGGYQHMECLGVNLIDEPAVGGIVITARDVTERVLMTEQLRHRALHDPLTDLPNRLLLQTTLEGALSGHDPAAIGLCFIDLDGFKHVNDTYSHAVGDQVLAMLAERLKDAIRQSDFVARVGGDEFVVVLDPISGPTEAVSMAQRLHAVLTEWPHPAVGVACGASIGVAMSQPGDTASNLLNRADAAMYWAKANPASPVGLSHHGTIVDGVVLLDEQD